VRLYAASTDELARQARSTGARAFPKGARTVARDLLRPGLTWYMVELAAPGQAEGFRYHLVFFDGEQWTMMGPLWSEPR
jgi:hypothetical protein